mmetsp:Transcript_4017/g.5279  ORF Transcript_4017/g.5279 Transcript_4017/m.5279 type:complete len:235 (+) Transcript_4017:158-862(+)
MLSFSSRSTRSDNSFRFTAGLLLCLFVFESCIVTDAWTVPHIRNTRALSRRTAVQVVNEPTEGASTIGSKLAESAIDDDDDDDDYEILEYESLTEAEFVKSEWLVGTVWDDKQKKIDETWVRLLTDDKGKNICYWGDNSEGQWKLDQASQFLSISKESIFGKQIWACTVDDYYYLSGTVRGWTFWEAAEVLAQWQAKRLGVDPDEAGAAPWFEENNDDDASEAQQEQLPESSSA